MAPRAARPCAASGSRQAERRRVGPLTRHWRDLLSPLARPPADLREFPERHLPRGSRLFRIHSSRFGPWNFTRRGTGRFDLVGLPDQGTCYFAEEPAGCFLEVFRSFTAGVPEEELAARRLTLTEPPGELTLADCTEPRARFWGITGEIHSSPSYRETQAWAEALARSGFGGIRYLLRHDPSQRLAGIAVFGPAGPQPEYPGGRRQPIGDALIREVENRFGVRALAPPEP